MGCNSPGATHHLACDCREREWAERLAGADRALYAERERVVRAELRAASLSKELLAARMARDCQRKAREEADAYAGRANARIADLGERLDATEAVLRDAEKARKEAEERLTLKRREYDIEVEVHAATKRERDSYIKGYEAAESRAARLLTALKHLLKAFLGLHRAYGTGSAAQWPEVEDARAAIAAEEGK